MNWIARWMLAAAWLLGPAIAPAQGPPGPHLNGAVADPPAPCDSPAPGHPIAARVLYARGQLTVAANGASLNTVLREIVRYTGMRIDGSIPDERIYGCLGPASASEVLSRLLDGTGSNLALRASASGDPLELILTPRSPVPVAASPVAAAGTTPPTAAVANVTAEPGNGVTNSASPGASGAPSPAAVDAQEEHFRRIQELQQMQQSTRRH